MQVTPLQIGDAHVLAMLVLQSDFYRSSNSVKEATDNVLAWTLDGVLKPPPVVEVCERLTDYHFVNGIAVHTYHAQIQDDAGYWHCGRSPDDAVSQLTRSHPYKFENGKPLVIWCGRLDR